MLQRIRTTSVCAFGTFALLLFASSASAAPILDITVLPVTATPGQTGVAVFGSVTNNTGDTVYLNGDDETFTPSLVVPGSIDDNPFFQNTPTTLDFGASTGTIELFTFDVAPTATFGSFNAGTFSILGGIGAPNQANFDIIGSQPVTVNVVPEPSAASFTLIGFVLFGIRVGTRRIRSSTDRRT